MDETKLTALKEKIASAKLNRADLSTDEDLALAVMNLIGIEEHLHFTGQKTGNTSYYDLLQEVRTMRTDLMKRLLPKTEGETWCISKHLLSASMRSMEVGTKLQTQGRGEDAQALFKSSYDLFNMFLALKLQLLSLADIEGVTTGAAVGEERAKDEPMSLNDLMAELVNCCRE